MNLFSKYKIYAAPWKRVIIRKRIHYSRKLFIKEIEIGAVYVIQKKNHFVYYGESIASGKSKLTKVSTAYSGKRAVDRFLKQAGIIQVNNDRLWILV